MGFTKPIFNSFSYTSVRALIIILTAWSFVVYVCVLILSTQLEHKMPDQTMVVGINQAVKQQLKHSIQQNQELRQLIDDMMSDKINKQSVLKRLEKFENNKQNDGGNASMQHNPDKKTIEPQEPSEEYEQTRRRIRYNTQEMWNYFRSELGKIRKLVVHVMPELEVKINDVLKLGLEFRSSLLSDIEQLQQFDGYEEWRQKESRELNELVQRRLNFIQNPKDCTAVIINNMQLFCGFGCQIHDVVRVLLKAYASQRTMLLNSQGWPYHKVGWEVVLKPVSYTCSEFDARDDIVREIDLPLIYPYRAPPYFPLAIPEDLAPRLKRLHGDPSAWWVGQFVKYLFKPQQMTQNLLKSGMQKLGWKRPIVGVHVRRTDKIGTEAASHEIEEYMLHVEEYYLTLESNGTKQPRRIFLATDEPHVIDEARMKYPHYEVLCDPDIAQTAKFSRYSNSSLNGIIFDIHMLSISDYLVCTFSSKVCRISYELMQTLHTDAAHRFKSLDDVYFFVGQNEHRRRAVIKHKAQQKNEIDMEIDDLIGVAGNHWDGYSKGNNKRTKQEGLFPSFKTVNEIETCKMPTYPNA